MSQLSVVVAALACSALVPPAAAAGPGAASADAYGLLVDVKVLPSLASHRHGPDSRAAQEYPGAADAADEAYLARSGPHPSDGSVVRRTGVLTSFAAATAAPQGDAWAQVNDVALLPNSLVTADTVRAQASTGCAEDADATGSIFENLRVNGQPVERTPAPNTTYDLGIATVILNEQHPAADGNGIVVNAIHVLGTARGDALFRGDVIVAHAMTSADCPDPAAVVGEPAADAPVTFDLAATPAVARPGTEVTFTARVTNESTQPLVVNALIDHLPAPLEHVSTSGDLGDEPDITVTRPNGGVDVIVGNGTTIPAGETVEQRFVALVPDGTEAATYFNNVELFLADRGNYVAGLGTPVQVVPEVIAGAGGGSGDETQDDDAARNDTADRGALPATGAPVAPYVIGSVLLGLSLAARRLRTSA